jgi:hypothetical protein
MEIVYDYSQCVLTRLVGCLARVAIVFALVALDLPFHA